MKGLIDFESAQPFATRFFTEALEGQHIVNAYVFRGKDLGTLYKMVLRLAQIINCENKPNAAHACGQCQSCRWIEENAHPGVITVSNLTYLPRVDPETGTSKSKTGKAQQSIVVEQLETLLKELSLHSGGFHRIIILTGAQETSLQEEDIQSFPPPKDWKVTEGVEFKLHPLDRKLFPDRLANKFLKTLEEPPHDAIFFLLTDSEEKLLDTIVSRCQLVPFTTPRNYYQMVLPPRTQETFQQILQGIPGGDCVYQARLFAEYMAEISMNTAEGLTQFQAFLWEQAGQLSPEQTRFTQAKGYIQKLEHAKKMIQDKVREEAVLEDLFLQMANR